MPVHGKLVMFICLNPAALCSVQALPTILPTTCAPTHIHAHPSTQLHLPICKHWHLPRFFLSILRYAKVATHLYHLLRKHSPKHNLAKYLLLTLAMRITAKAVDLLALGGEGNKVWPEVKHCNTVVWS